MAAFTLQNNILSCIINSLLWLQNCSYWLKCYIKINILPIADPSLYATRIIGFGTYVSLLIGIKLIIVLRTSHTYPFKAAPVLKTFNCIYT